MIADHLPTRIDNRASLMLERGAHADDFVHNVTMPSVSAADAETLRPPLKWAGGKRWLVAQLRGWWYPHRYRRYIEPFCGGLAGALGLNPDDALLNDNNAPLIHFYRALQTGLSPSDGLINTPEAYYAARAFQLADTGAILTF